MITGREMMEELLRKGREQGIAQGIAPLMRQLERRLERQLVAAERERVLARIDKLGPERVGDVVLDLAPTELAA